MVRGRVGGFEGDTRVGGLEGDTRVGGVLKAASRWQLTFFSLQSSVFSLNP
jgi:hypothetical protein